MKKKEEHKDLVDEYIRLLKEIIKLDKKFDDFIKNNR